METIPLFESQTKFSKIVIKNGDMYFCTFQLFDARRIYEKYRYNSTASLRQSEVNIVLEFSKNLSLLHLITHKNTNGLHNMEWLHVVYGI